MRFLAITGPRALRSDVNSFRSASANILDVMESPALDAVAIALAANNYGGALLFGGDGTLNRYLTLLHKSGVAALLVPSGSGNDFSMANGIFTVTDALGVFRKALSGQVSIREADLGCARYEDGSERLFACCFNVGVDADAARRTNALPNFLKERQGYMIGGALAILNYRRERIAISGDGIPAIDEAGWFVAVSNTPTYGGGLKIAPQANITDGLLDVTYLHPIPRFEVMRHFPKILTGAHVSLNSIAISRTAELRIETNRPLPINADGEAFGATPVTVRVIAKGIRVFTAV